MSPEDKLCEEYFITTHSRDSHGRYIVRLPLKKSADTLGDSKEAALRSLTRLSKKMQYDSSYRKCYSDFIHEYEALGHMSLVLAEELNYLPIYYLPHHGVLREQNRITKLRVVFNASSQTETGLSLNDILHSGKKLQTEISDLNFFYIFVHITTFFLLIS